MIACSVTTKGIHQNKQTGQLSSRARFDGVLPLIECSQGSRGSCARDNYGWIGLVDGQGQALEMLCPVCAGGVLKIQYFAGAG